MRKVTMLISVVLVLVLAVEAGAQTRRTEQPLKDDGPPKPLSDWTFFQLGFFPTVPGATVESNVYGMKLGLPTCAGDGRVYGLEPSLLYSGTSYIKGAQGSWFGVSICREIDGVQGGAGVAIAKLFRGIQAGGVSVTKEGYGFQAGIVNVAQPFYGFQAAAVNVAESVTGVQLGVVNYTEKQGCQFGFINIIKDGLLPVSLIFNISF